MKTQPETWVNGPLFGFDIESTDADPMTARIVTAAIVLDLPNEEPKIFSWFANPGCEISLGATSVHGISTQDAVEKGQDMRETLLEILATIEKINQEYGTIPLVCCNAIFDLTIVNNELIRLGINPDGLQLNNPIIDSLICDRKLDPYRVGRRTLTAACANYSIVVRGAHRCENDVIATIELVRAMGKKFPHFARIPLEKLQIMQRTAAAERADSFMRYRRMDGKEPDFTIEKDWPILGKKGTQ
jgi:DNA polymerase III subunit epsilon